MIRNVFENGFCKLDGIIFKVKGYKYENNNKAFLEYLLLDIVEDQDNFNEKGTPNTIEKEYFHPDIPESIESWVNQIDKGNITF